MYLRNILKRIFVNTQRMRRDISLKCIILMKSVIMTGNIRD